MNEQDQTERLQRYAACEADHREWAEKCGYENLRQRIESGDAIAKQAATMMALLLAGIGGALNYALRIFEQGPAPVPVGAAFFGVWLVVLAGVLLMRCIQAADAPTLYNSPNNLLIEPGRYADVRAGELLNLQERIEQQIARNNTRAMWLNRVRVGALASPLAFVLPAVLVMGRSL